MIPLDPSELKSREEALRRLDEVAGELRDASSLIGAAARGGITWLHVFAMSAAVRAVGLHQAVRSVIETDNPHAAFPLLRTYLEVGTVVCYVADHPEYARVLAGRPEADPISQRRRTSQALIQAAAKRYPGIKAVWDELSEVAHVGSPAFWMPWVIESNEERLTTIASWPRWRQPEDALIASAHALEFGTVVVTELGRILDSHLKKFPRPEDIVAEVTFAQPGGKPPADPPPTRSLRERQPMSPNTQNGGGYKNSVQSGKMCRSS